MAGKGTESPAKWVTPSCAGREHSVIPVIGRLVVDDLHPRTPDRFPAKAAVGEKVRITAVVFKDGHDPIAARALLFKDDGSGVDRDKPVAISLMKAVGNDEWEGHVVPTDLGRHQMVVQGWSQKDGPVDPEDAVDLTSSEPHPLWIDRERALVGAWYELFPRSFGGFDGAAKRVPDLADMGFDILYLPPIHPIGHTARKGPNNTLAAGPDDPGSPWAIGSEEGGHTSIASDLGTLEDFHRLVAVLEDHDMEIALDYALQCSPDHPWVREHPEWFHHRPDGTIACAENPPKVYQDIYPLNFWPPTEKDRVAMWKACKGILDYWIAQGVRIFRVDNPHTKPMAFWQWLIAEVQQSDPEIIFLAEAFTRPKVMAKLAELGFTQSYSYFTWRTEQHGPDGLRAYLDELAHGPKAEYMRPNFWPNTPDILSGPLRNGPPAAFALRYVLAATMSPSYGVYSGYELFENQPASESNEEYLRSEKYEMKHREFDQPWSLEPLFRSVNRIRRRHPALQRLRTIRFHDTTNPEIIAYSKVSDDGADTILTVVNLDPHSAQDAIIDLWSLGVPFDRAYLIVDELAGDTFEWRGSSPYVRLDPSYRVAHIFDMSSALGAPAT
jgi:starch synthase (maltosyl-transferring)